REERCVEGGPMQFQVKGRNLEVSDAIRSYAESKLSKLERQLTNPRVELELAVERNPSIAQNHVAEATIWTNGPVLRARAASADKRVNRLGGKSARQRPGGGARRGGAARANGRPPDPMAAMTKGDEPQIVKTKQFSLSPPMNAEEAVLQLELVGHDFFVFRNA